MRGAVGWSSIICDWHEVWPDILQHCDKKVKTKTQKVEGANSYICKSYMGKTGRGGCVPGSWFGTGVG